MRAPHEKPILVLLVEDDRDHAFLVKEAMRRSGIACKVEVATNGPAALERVRRGVEGAEDAPDLIVMDLHMPRMGAREVLADLRSRRETRVTPVVILTTSCNPADVRDCYDKGAVSYISKPVHLEELLRAMKVLLEYWSGTAQLPGRAHGAAAGARAA